MSRDDVKMFKPVRCINCAYFIHEQEKIMTESKCGKHYFTFDATRPSPLFNRCPDFKEVGE